MLLIGFSMASQTPRTSVYVLESSFGVSLGCNSQPDPSELGGVQSSFTVSGSLAESQKLCQHHRACATPWNQEALFLCLDGPAEQGFNATIHMATVTMGSSSECVTTDLNTHQSTYSFASKNQYRINLILYSCVFTLSLPDIFPFHVVPTTISHLLQHPVW